MLKDSLLGRAAFMYFADLVKCKKKKKPLLKVKFELASCGMSCCLRNRCRCFDMLLTGSYGIHHNICNSLMLCNLKLDITAFV